MSALNDTVDRVIARLAFNNIFSNSTGFARTILALSTLLTLLCNEPDTLFRPAGVTKLPNKELISANAWNFFFLLPYTKMPYMKWAAIIVLAIVVSGWRPRFTCIPHFWISNSFINSAILIEGGDQIISNLTLLLLPICLLDSRKWHWTQQDVRNTKAYSNLIANFFYGIIRIQVAIIYFHAAIGKMFVDEWANGTALYYWLNDPVFGPVLFFRHLLVPVIQNPTAIVLLTWGVIVFEIILFMALIMSAKQRRKLLWPGIIFHVLIVVFHGLFSFCLAMIGALILYLYPLTEPIRIGKHSQ
jgi:antimicrobial peptide system SdpB family protein